MLFILFCEFYNFNASTAITAIKTLASELHTKYHIFYVKKISLDLGNKTDAFLRQIHNQYTRTKIYTSLDMVYSMLEKSKASEINQLLKELDIK